MLSLAVNFKAFNVYSHLSGCVSFRIMLDTVRRTPRSGFRAATIFRRFSVERVDEFCRMSIKGVDQFRRFEFFSFRRVKLFPRIGVCCRRIFCGRTVRLRTIVRRVRPPDFSHPRIRVRFALKDLFDKKS
jgi:hypothetical protein